ncbi:MAG: TonB-dependent receptor, partial [Nitrincola sp.]|nr:TonB-dependent receptor [Nitrincola sp.]
SVKYRRIPQEFTGSTEVLGGGIKETSNDMLAGRASIWAGGPMSENFGLLGGLNINNSPSNRQHVAEQTNADGSFRESFNRIDRKDVTRINTFLKMGWELDQGYFEFEPQLFTETVSTNDVRKTQTPAHNGSDDNRFITWESESITGGANLRLEQQLSEHWHLDSRLSWFLSDQDKTMDEIRLRYRGGALHGTPTVSNTSESLTDELLELRTALAYDWSATHLGKFELGLQARRNERDGSKSSIENGVVQNPSSGDIYNLQENYLAGWARQQFKFLDETLRVEPGVRIEDYRLNALSNDGQGGNNTQSSHHLHIGPSLHTAWRISPQMTLQGAISRTLNRPQLDQITPSREQKGQEIVVGNPDLNPATAINSDLGLVWSTPDLFLAATIFHKKIDDLIVNSLTGEQEGSRNIVQPINIESGTLRGLELEQRYHLGATGIRQLDGLTIWSNQTLFDGKMRLASGRHVPFFGEPDYLLAAGIDWISPSSNLQMSLAINHNGKRTEEDEFSRKRFDKLTTVDLTAAYAINRDIRLRFEASNLFNEQESGPKSFFNANHELTHVEHRTVSIPQTLWLGFDMKF